VAITFFKQWAGDPRGFLEACQWSAPVILKRLAEGTHLNNGRAVPDFPFLRGKKIGPLWMRMLRDNVGLEIRDMDEVPIPVDVHVARASLAVGMVRGRYDGNLEGIYAEIRAWRESVKDLRLHDRPMIALDIDEPLWHLSKYGCTDRNLVDGVSAPRRLRCEGVLRPWRGAGQRIDGECKYLTYSAPETKSTQLRWQVCFGNRNITHATIHAVSIVAM
jgi:hypothetical protein